MPEDWERPRHWLAYVAWATGSTRAEAAEASGYSTGHVGRLASEWLDRWDCTDLTPNPGGLTPQDIEKGHEASAVARRLAWKARQEGLADDLGDDVETMRATLRAILQTCFTPDRLQNVDPVEAAKVLRDVAYSMERVSKLANQAAGIPDVNRTMSLTAGRFGDPGPEDPTVEPDLLGELLSVSGTPQDVLDAVELLAQGHLNETAPGSLYEAVVEVGEAEPA